MSNCICSDCEYHHGEVDATKAYNKITNYNAFVLYCLRRLGGEVINIEVSDNQVRDRISDAIQFFREEHVESTREFWIVYKVTQADVTRGYINIDPDIIDVVDIRGSNNSSFGTDLDYLDDPSYYFMSNYFGGSGGLTQYATGELDSYGNFSSYGSGSLLSGLTYYYLNMSQLQTLRQVLSAEVQFSWRPRLNQLYLYRKMVANEILIMRVYKMWDPDTEGELFDNQWLKSYATALLGLQNATNLSKFTNIPSSGGITVDATNLLQRYTEEKTQLETDFKMKYQAPPMLFIG